LRFEIQITTLVSLSDCAKTAERRPTPKKRTETMRRSASFLALVMLSAPATVLLPNSSFAEFSHSRDCQDKLVGNSYECTYTFFFGNAGAVTHNNCLEFVTGGLSQNFDLVGVDGSLASDYGCACEEIGSFKSPSTKSSANAFECVGDLGNVVQFHGKIDSNKLHGQASEESGVEIVFDCKKRKTACP